MYGSRLRTFVFGLTGLAIVTFLTIFAVAPSWSQYALTSFGYVFTAAILAISEAFGERARSHPFKNKQLFKWFGKPVRLEHTSRFTQIMFLAIVIFPCTQVEVFGEKLLADQIVDVMHYVATGLAVLGIYLEMIRWYPTWSKNWWINVIVINLAVAYFLLELYTPIISIAAGELAVAYAAFGHVIKTNYRM